VDGAWLRYDTAGTAATSFPVPGTQDDTPPVSFLVPGTQDDIGPDAVLAART